MRLPSEIVAASETVSYQKLCQIVPTAALYIEQALSPGPGFAPRMLGKPKVPRTENERFREFSADFIDKSCDLRHDVDQVLDCLFHSVCYVFPIRNEEASGVAMKIRAVFAFATLAVMLVSLPARLVSGSTYSGPAAGGSWGT